MKKTLGLVGLFFVGLALLANPSTGILAATDEEPVVVVVETTTTVSGDPPPDTAVDEPVVTATAAPTTTTTTDISSGTYSVVGSVEASRWGSFQVEAVFDDGVLVDVIALQLPTDRKSQAINEYAVPIYEEAVLEQQSTDIDVVSGATITWTGYTNSLQSALDEAGLAT